jgi:hypothetical protein
MIGFVQTFFSIIPFTPFKRQHFCGDNLSAAGADYDACWGPSGLPLMVKINTAILLITIGWIMPLKVPLRGAV